MKGLLDTNKRLKDAMLFNILSFMSNQLLGRGSTAASIDELYLFLTNMQRLRSTDTDTAEKTKILIGAPKSDTSVRTIPLTDNAAELCRKFAVRNPCAYILTGTSEFMEPRSFQYRIEKYTRECGLDGIHAHTLRHTFATRAVEVGFEIKTLSEILGHANTTITLNRYVHTSLELKRTNMDKLAALAM